MPTTSNFGWTTPADTDLVKDGAAAIRTLGNGIDTSFIDLKGGTTGQVLSKASNTDLDYSWVTPNVGDITEVQAGTGISIASGTGPIPVVTNTVATAFDAAGDLVYGTGADTFTKLSLGTAGQVLTVNSGATAPQWSAPSTGAITLIASTTLSAATSTITFNSIPNTYNHLIIKWVCSGADDWMRMYFNNITTSTYYSQMDWGRQTTPACENLTASGSLRIGYKAAQGGAGELTIPQYKATTLKKSFAGYWSGSAGTAANDTRAGTSGGRNDATTAISRIEIVADSNYDIGSAFYLYGVI